MLAIAKNIGVHKKLDHVPFSPQRVREERTKRGWDQNELSKRCDGLLSQGAISQIESGKANPKERVLRVLGAALGVVFFADWQNDSWDDKKKSP